MRKGLAKLNLTHQISLNFLIMLIKIVLRHYTSDSNSIVIGVSPIVTTP